MAPGYYDDDDDQEQTQGPKALRDKLKAVEKERDDAIKERDKLQTEVETLTKTVKSTTLRDALTDAGIDAKYARFAERDGVEATPESVKKWVEESKDVYAFLKPAAAPAADDAGDDDGTDEGPEDEVDPDLADGVRAGQRLSSEGRPGGSKNVLQTLEGVDLSQFKTDKEVDDFIRGLGAPTTASG